MPQKYDRSLVEQQEAPAHPGRAPFHQLSEMAFGQSSFGSGLHCPVQHAPSGQLLLLQQRQHDPVLTVAGEADVPSTHVEEEAPLLCSRAAEGITDVAVEDICVLFEPKTVNLQMHSLQPASRLGG